MNSLFRCPLCSAPLEYDAHTYRCPSGHCFDRGATGYTYLLPANRKHSKSPGDDKEMVASRSAFLDQGYYGPLRDALCSLVLHVTEDNPSPVLLDSGCGEGYYTYGMHETLCKAGKSPLIAGVDLSKFALRRAAKRLGNAEFAVASVYSLPSTDNRFDVLTNIFSPLALDEFYRVMKPNGYFLYVVPSALHLWEMKQILYQEPYENPIKLDTYTGFSYQESVQVRTSILLPDSSSIMDLFGMTPYVWKTPQEGIARLQALDHLQTQIGFDIHVYQRQ